MDAHAFLEKHGRRTAEKVAKAAGTNYAYFNQIAYGHRRPSPELARKLVKASERVVPEEAARLDLEGLLFPKAA